MNVKDLSIIHPYYRGEDALHLHQQFWMSYTDAQKARVKLILVDDCSPTPLTDLVRVIPGLEMEIYRITDDLKWNQHGARNLGALVADTPLLLMIDWDCGFRSADLNKVLGNGLKPGQFMRFASTRSSKPRYNQFLCWRSDFIRFNGYDEDYTGTYGGDGSLMQQFEKNLTEIVMPAVMQGTPGRTPDMDRDADRLLYDAVKEQKKLAGRVRDKRMLRFQWERVL